MIENIIIVLFSIFRIIMKTFKLITRFNILINNQRYIDLNVFYAHILKTRRTYQKLILYIIMIVKDFNKEIEE